MIGFGSRFSLSVPDRDPGLEMTISAVHQSVMAMSNVRREFKPGVDVIVPYGKSFTWDWGDGSEPVKYCATIADVGTHVYQTIPVGLTVTVRITGDVIGLGTGRFLRPVDDAYVDFFREALPVVSVSSGCETGRLKSLGSVGGVSTALDGLYSGLDHGTTHEESNGPSVVWLPFGVHDIGDSLFANNTRVFLGAFSIPRTVRRIGISSFANCRGLFGLTGGSGLSELGMMAFTQCVNLQDADLSASMFTEVPRYCFGSCTGLHAVGLPSSVSSIQADAFNGCTGLKTVTIKSAVPPDVIGGVDPTPESVFPGFGDGFTLSVPTDCIDAYLAHPFWYGFRGKFVLR